MKTLNLHPNLDQFNGVRRLKAAAGHCFLAQGVKPSHCFYILNGQVQLEVHDKELDRKARLSTIFTAGDCIAAKEYD